MTGSTVRSVAGARTTRWATLWLGFCYPILAHVAVLTGRAALIAASVGVLVTLILLQPLSRRRPWAWLLYVTSLAGLYRLSGSGAAMLPLFVPPVALNAFMGWVFGHTLATGQVPLIEQIARAMGDPGEPLPPDVTHYARQVTVAWTALFLVLTIVNLVLALCAVPDGVLIAAGRRPPFAVPLEAWSLFANVLNYLFVGALFAVEYALRHRRFPQRGYRNFFDFTRRVVRLGALFRPVGSDTTREP